MLKQAAPGADWALGSGHEIEFEYRTNTTTDAVREFKVSLSLANNTHTPTLELRATNGGRYDAGALYRTVTKDENHDGTSSKLHTTEEFTDKQGRVVLKRTYALVSSTETAHDTYYVYDDHGNLSYVLPPEDGGGHGHPGHAAEPNERSGLPICVRPQEPPGGKTDPREKGGSIWCTIHWTSPL